MKSFRTIFLVWMALVVVARGEVFKILDTGISFEGPKGFTVLTAEEIKSKYPNHRPPAFVIGNDRRSTTIACNFRDDPLPAEAIVALKDQMGKMLEQVVPGIEWKEKKVTEVGGRQWIYYEMTSRAIDTDIYNIMLITSFRGKMLGFNFNSTKAEFPKVEAELRKSMASIVLPEK
jgi:hypothetical protein